MYLMRNNDSQSCANLKDECEKLLFFHVTLTMTDGNTFDGIIESVDGDQVIVLVGEDVLEQEDNSQVDQQRFGGGGRRFRRFNRRVFPLVGLAALSLLAYPYYAPYYYPPYPPYYNPYYPPYYPY